MTAPIGYDSDRETFVGAYGDLAAPAVVVAGEPTGTGFHNDVDVAVDQRRCRARRERDPALTGTPLPRNSDPHADPFIGNRPATRRATRNS